jgi:hypothetical protein
MMPVIVNAQVLTKKDIIPLVCTFQAGIYEGFAEGLKFHYESIDSKLGLNDNYWNPAMSCNNKYKNGDPAQGEAFPMSTTVFVWTTDGYHLTRAARNTCLMAGLTFKLGEKQKWYEYLLEFIAYYITFTLGFNITYELL